MPWTERQHALLRAIGLRAWSPPVAEGDVRGAAVETEPAPSVPSAPVSVGAGAATLREHQPQPQPPGAGPLRAEDGPGAHVEADRARPAPSSTDARATAIAALDWPALRSAVADCRACGLCGTRRQTVFGVGGTQAHWMVVGEAPGEQEDRQGEPFVGPAGRLLDQMLAALGLTRDADAPVERQVYIANTLKCRPPGNRNPAPDEMTACEPFLQRQLALVQPRIVLAMGRFAVQALLRSSEPVGRLRGRVHVYAGVPLVVTYHPAYLLRNLPDKARAWQDLCLAAATAERAGAGPEAGAGVSASA